MPLTKIHWALESEPSFLFLSYRLIQWDRHFIFSAHLAAYFKMTPLPQSGLFISQF